MTFAEFVHDLMLERSADELPDLLDTFDDTELNDEPEPQMDPQTGFVNDPQVCESRLRAPEFPLCEDCGERYAVEGEDYCPDCRDNRAEAAYERQQEGECFRGGEAAAFAAELQERARRLK